MSNPKILNGSAWKDLAAKNKIKDNGLHKELLDLGKLDDEHHDAVVGSIERVIKIAGDLKKSKDIAANRQLADFIKEVLDEAEAKRKAALKAKAEAEKKAQVKAAADAKKQKEEDRKAAKDEEEDEDEDPGGDALETLKRQFKSLRTSRIPYHFLVCDAKPYGLVIAKRSIKSSARHKKVLAELAGGNRRPPKHGLCYIDGKELVLEMEKPVAGLTRVLQRWIVSKLGLRFKVRMGEESSDDEDDGAEIPDLVPVDEEDEGADAEAAAEGAEEEEAGEEVEPEVEEEEEEEEEPPAAAEDARPKLVLPKASLAQSPQVWKGARDQVQARIDELRQAVQAQLSDEDGGFVAQINEQLGKLDRILDKLDGRLSAVLANASQADDAEQRAIELRQAKGLVADYIRYVGSEPLIAHIDSNPFGIKTQLKATLAASLTQLARAIS